MTSLIEKYKKPLAKEVLLLFGAVGLCIIEVLIFLAINLTQQTRENHFYNKLDKLNTELSELKTERNSEQELSTFKSLNEEKLILDEKKEIKKTIRDKNFEQISFENGLHLTELTGYILLLLLYPIRILFITLKWAINTVKK